MTYTKHHIIIDSAFFDCKEGHSPARYDAGRGGNTNPIAAVVNPRNYPF